MREMSVEERVAVLTSWEGWFGRAPQEFQKELLARFVCRAGQPVHHTADQRADLVAVVNGTVEIYTGFGIGDNPLLHLGHEGLWLGFGSVISGAAPHETIIARIDTLLARIRHDAVMEVLRERPGWWRLMASAAAEYANITNSALSDLLIPEKERRCACTLLRIAGLRPPRRSHSRRADVSVTQGELAAMLNFSRTTLVDVLRGLERRGLIEQGYRMLRVVDPLALTEFARAGVQDASGGRGQHY